MRHAVLAVLLAAIASAPLSAKEGARRGAEPPEEGAAQDMGEMMLRVYEKELNLTDDQKGKVKAVLDEGKPKRQELQMRLRELTEQMRKLQRRDSERIRGLLNEEQREKFDDINVRMRQKMQMGPGGFHHKERQGHEDWRRGPRSPEPPPGFDRERRMPGDDRPEFPPEFIEEIPGKGSAPREPEAPQSPEGQP